MATTKRPLIRANSKSPSRLTDRVVSMANNTLTPTANLSTETTGSQSQPPAGFNDPGTKGVTDKIPGRPTAGSLSSSNNDRQALVSDKMGLVDKATVVDGLLGRGGQGNSESNPLTDLMGSDRNKMPGVDQGFGSSPDSNALADIGAAFLDNPMNAFQSESAGGLLAPSQSQNPQSIASMGKESISAGGTGVDLLKQAVEEAEAEQAAKAKAGGEKADSATPAAAQDDQSGIENPFTTAQGARDGTDGVEGNQSMAASAVEMVKNVLSFFGKEVTTEEINQGVKNMFGLGNNRTGGEILNDPEAGGGVGVPDPETQGINVNIITSTILEQMIATQAGKTTSQGGSSDSTPVNDGGFNGVVHDGFIAHNQSSIDARNLFGQPVGPAGDQNISGGNKGLDVFGGSNGAGVIDPGMDGLAPQGDPRFAEAPGQFFGGRQTGPNLEGGRTQSRGSAEDLLLSGTDSADVLTGLSGNDILDGRRGLDQLTGGAGADRFRFSAGSGFGQANADLITDFNRAEGDRIEISREAFGLAAGTSVNFQSVSTDQELNLALLSDSLFVHDQRSGSLLFNQNGAAAGFGGGGTFATLTGGIDLQASDLALIA